MEGGEQGQRERRKGEGRNEVNIKAEIKNKRIREEKENKRGRKNIEQQNNAIYHI
jgi:hypothetical protein